MTDTLKPCPFCGGEAELTWMDGFPLVQCKECNCATGISISGDGAKAIVAWNTRSPSTDREALIEALEAAPDEDWLTDVLNDSLDMDWTGRVGARAIIAAWSKRHVG